MASVPKPRFIILGGQKQKDKSDYSQVKQDMVPPSPLTKPICIRYFDPRIVPLMVELGQLSAMVQTFASRVSETTLKEQEEISQMIKSSKELSLKMESIIQEHQDELSGSFAPEKVDSEFKYIRTEENHLKSPSELTSDENNVDMIAILDKVSLRMEELEKENKSLRLTIQQLQTPNFTKKHELEEIQKKTIPKLKE